jgi:hypothetical protein
MPNAQLDGGDLTPCPMCGKNSLTETRGEYRFEPPKAIPGGAIVVPDAMWYECGACHEQIVPSALEQAIERGFAAERVWKHQSRG